MKSALLRHLRTAAALALFTLAACSNTDNSGMAAPSNVTAAVASGKVTLSWSGPAGASSFIVRRSVSNGGPYSQVATPVTAGYTDTAVSNGTTYYYVVAAVDGSATSPNSAEVRATPAGSGPATLTGGGSTPSSTPGAAEAIHASGNQILTASGKVVQLRGANVSGLEFVAIQGWDPTNPWGGGPGGEPNWTAITSWKLNTVRLPLNEASWLQLTTYDNNGTPRTADPGSNYRATVIKAVNDATAAGLWVILDLHWAAPNVSVPGQSGLVPASPRTQNAMADADHAIEFWTSVASTFQNNQAVVFELYNEPFFWWLQSGENQWAVLRDGGVITQYITGSQSPYSIQYNWKSAGMQQMLNAVRATGATNLVLTSGVGWAGDLSQWVAYAPKDPLNNLGAVWHAYPKTGAVWGTPEYSTLDWSRANAILAAQFPVVVTETGDRNVPGTVGAPLVSNVLSWADQNGGSVVGWSWNVWTDPNFVLIKDAAGTPTDGYGQVFHDWAVNHQ